jgi:hypothetical protein
VVLVVSVLLLVYSKQDEIIQNQIDKANKNQCGYIKIGNTHLEPFTNFPYISFKIDDVQVFEHKGGSPSKILDVADIFVGFELGDILSGNFNIHSLLIEDGYFNFILHEDGTNNIVNAIAKSAGNEDTTALDIHLQSISLRNLDVHKYDESSKLDIETYITEADGGFKSHGDTVEAHVDSKFVMNIIKGQDTTFIKNKHFQLHSDVIFDKVSGRMLFKPSGIVMEHGDFELKGTLDTKNEKEIDFTIKGTKPNFDMLIAFAPEDIIPVLEKYKNAGEIYFNASLKGATAKGNMPRIDAEFGASEAYLENTGVNKRVDNMGFEGHFTNGAEQKLETMEFSLKKMTANLEKGKFLGSIMVKNFKEPEIDMSLKADFELKFLTGFFNLKELKSATGEVKLDMRFHDVIDLEHPEHALDKINQAYYCELVVKDLALTSVDLPAPLKKLNLHVTMNGKEADIDVFDLIIGESDIFVKGYISDLPAIIHHTDKKVKAQLKISSKTLNLSELTKYSKKDSLGFDEQIDDLNVSFSFVSSARAFTESKYLPEGEFFIDNLHAKLKHYPHELHDFHIDVLVGDRDLKIKDFTGFIDESDFQFNGVVRDYGFWFQDTLNGDVNLDITLKSKALHLDDVFSYKGENYVPKDYRHEEFDKLNLHVNSSMHYKHHKLQSIDVNLDKLNAKMRIHPFRIDKFKGQFHFEDEHIMIRDFQGKLGHTVFNIGMNYYLGEDETIKKRDNLLTLKANYIDFDELFNFRIEPIDHAVAPHDSLTDVKKHTEAFNLYELPFTDMKFDVEVGHFMHHRVDLREIKSTLRTTHNHYIYVDTLSLFAAGGEFHMSGCFNGSDPKHIYLKPKLSVRDVDIDKLFFKFENFGQEELLSKNINGQLTADISGEIRMYPDLVPDLDQSEIHLDIELVSGRLHHYRPIEILSDYVEKKDLTNIKFDTLKSQMDITKGLINIPRMTLESSLGHFDFSGKQDLDHNIEYYVSVPWKLVGSSARSKLFGGKKKTKDLGVKSDNQIIKNDSSKKIRYLNLKIHGKIDDFKISIGKKPKNKKKET